MKQRILCGVMVVLMFSMLLIGCGESKSNEVHIAIQPSAAFVPLYIAKEKGWIEEALEPYGVSVVWNEFESGPPMNDSLLAEDSDIGVIGDVPVVTVCAPGNDVKLIAIAAQAADSYAMLVPGDSDIQTAADLEGKRVATTFGSTGHNMVEKFLNTVGLTINDINLVNIAAGDAQFALTGGEADAVSIWEPNVTRLCDGIGTRIIGEGSDCGLAGTNGIVARTEYAEANPEVVSAILDQYARAAEQLPSMDEETMKAVAKELSVEPEQMQTIIPKFHYTVEITPEDLASLNDTIAFLNNNQILRTSYDITEQADGSYYHR